MMFEDDDVLKGIDLSLLGKVMDKTNPIGGGEEIENDPLNNFHSSVVSLLNGEEVEEETKEDNNSTEDTETEESNSEEDSASSEEESSTETDAMKVFANMVAGKLGVDFAEEEYKDDDEFILSLVDKKLKAEREAEEASLDPEIKELIANHKAGVPIHKQLQAKEITYTYKSIEAESVKNNIELQKGLIRDKLLNTGISEEKALKKIEKYELTGILEEEALDALEDLQVMAAENEKAVIETEKENYKKRMKEYQDWSDSLKNQIDKKEEIIPGIKLDPTQKKQLYEGIVNKDRAGKNAIQKFYESNPDFNLVVAYLATVLKGDLSVIQKTANTKAVRNLKDIVSSSSKDGGVTSAPRKIKPADVSVMKNALNLK
jgi:hypothetical protein